MDSFGLSPEFDIAVMWKQKEGLDYIEILACRNNRVMEDFLNLKKYFIQINPSFFMVNPVYDETKVCEKFCQRYCAYFVDDEIPYGLFDNPNRMNINPEFSSEDDDFEDEPYTNEKIDQILRRIPPLGNNETVSFVDYLNMDDLEDQI